MFLPCEKILRFKFTVSLLLLGWLILAGIPQNSFAAPVSVNTAALTGTPARLDFVLFDGDLTANNSATIAGLITNGTLQGTDCTVSCAGGPPFTISDAGGFGEFIQDLVLGTTLSFNLTSTVNFTGGDADLLIVNLLNPATNFTLVDTNLDALSAPVPHQDALLVLDLSNGRIQTPASTIPQLIVTAGAATIPEPSNMMLVLIGGALLIWQHRRRSYGEASTALPGAHTFIPLTLIHGSERKGDE